MFLLVLAYPGSLGQKAVTRLCAKKIENDIWGIWQEFGVLFFWLSVYNMFAFGRV